MPRENNERAIRRYCEAWRSNDLPTMTECWLYDEDQRAVDEFWS
jgi:hypothetical protein